MTDWKNTVQVGYETAEEKLAFRDGKNVGIKKVVEWFMLHKDDEQGYDWGERQGSPIEIFMVDPLELQIKLKKWGIEND